MKQFFVTFAAVVMALLIVFVVLPVALVFSAISASKPTVSGEVVVSVDLRQPLTDQSVSAPFAFLTGTGQSTMSIITTLHHAAEDSKVKAVFIRLPENGISPAAAEEIRRAVIHLRGANKPVIAHSQGLYPDSMIMASYMVGASASELWMQPGAGFQATGLTSSTLFFKRSFEKFGIQPNFEQRYEYKNAVNPYLYTDYTPAHKAAQTSWMESIYDSLLSSVAQDLRQDKAQLRSTLEAGPYTAPEALNLKLISHIGHVKQAEAAALGRGKDAKLIDINEYSRTISADTSGAVIAVINGEGPIMTGASSSGFGTETMMLSDTVAKAFYDAIDSKRVKAIIFRVSSPGGSDTASDQIAFALKAAREAGKPVIVSMGDYAASGGYWISAGATTIVANPSSLTGSIGVYGGKFNISEGLSKLGIDVRDINLGGDYANAFAEGRNFTPTQRAAISEWIDQVYNGFITHVATARNLPEAQVRDMAKGRVWTGQQALGLKLVDRVGGFYDAVDEAKAQAGLDPKAKVRLVDYTNRSDGWKSFGHTVGMGATGLRVLSMLGWAMSDPKAEAVIDRVYDERLRSQGANIMAPRAY